MPCVGLVVLGGCLTFIVAPDEPPSREEDATMADALPTVVLDAGHGGRDEGARANGLVEKELTLDVVQRTEKILQSFGYPTVLTRRDNATHVSLQQRAELANRYKHSVFISVHFDKHGHTPASGVATFYAESKVAPTNSWSWVGFFDHGDDEEELDTGETLAGYLQTALLARTDANNRGIKARDLYVVRNVRAPAVLVEGGFLSNAFDAQLLATPEYRERIATAIAEGVLAFQKSQPRRARPARLANASSP